MLVLTRIPPIRARREELARTGKRVAFVPTMGALHEGHLALVRHGHDLADEVWASVFVNPGQFGPSEDFASYPRDLERDCALLEREGTTLLFAPSTREIYPRPPATVVDLPELTAGLCGPHRPGHFRGVALVVAKLLNIVQPHVAVFGAKDWQQAVVIRRMVEDLDMPVHIDVHPTVREEDALARSSRNAYLSPEERLTATVLSHALGAAAHALRGGETRGSALELILANEVARAPGVRLQYAAAVDPATLQPVVTAEGPILFALAAHVGSTRLIDNLLVEGS